jgi:hypothetical protein
MKIEARGFVTDKRWESAMPLTRYLVKIVHEARPDGCQAAISGEIPLLVYANSPTDDNFTHAMESRTLIKVTVEIGEEEKEGCPTTPPMHLEAFDGLFEAHDFANAVFIALGLLAWWAIECRRHK